MAGNDIGNGLMSCGCMIMLLPIIAVLLVVMFSVLGAMFGMGA